MFDSNKKFEKFARDHKISSLNIHNFKKYQEKNGYIKNYTTSPMVIEERQLNASTISVFDRLMMDRIIFLGEEIDDCVANIINAQLLFLDTDEDNTEPIWLYINSPGGDCYSGLAIYDTMQMVKSEIHTCVMGLACSMAFLLAVAGKKKHRYSLKHSRLLMHQPLGGMQYSQATDIEIFNKEMQNIKSDLMNIIAYHTGKDKDLIKIDAERDYWMTAVEAIEYGAIDKMLIKMK